MTLWRLSLVGIAASLSGAAQSMGPSPALLGRAPIDTQLEQELLKVICPNEMSGRTCTKCPAFTSWRQLGGQVSLENAIRGHFTSAHADELVVALMGCEPHMLNWGGTILFERRGGGWRMRWYNADFRQPPPTDCRKFTRLDGRDLLLCTMSHGGQGNYWHVVFARDFAQPRDARDQIMFAVFGNALNCQGRSQGLESKEPFRRVASILEAQSTDIAVRFRIAWGADRWTPSLVAECEQNRDQGWGPRRRLGIVTVAFDGTRFSLTPESLRELESIEKARN